MERDRAYLLDIIESAKLALSYINEVSREEFLRDTQCQDSVIRRIEIIGEAARRVSLQTKNAYPGIPWSEIIGMRNLVIHDYDDVDPEIILDTVQQDIPGLIELIKPLLPPEINEGHAE